MTRAQRNHIDLPTLITVLTLMVLSLGVVYSASATWAMEKFGESNRLLNLHALKVLLGLVALFVGMTIDYRKYKKLTKPAVILSIIFLTITLVLGGEVKGATRWLRFGGLSLQPSEFAKFALLFHLCTLISTKGEAIRDFKKGFLPMLSVMVNAFPSVSRLPATAWMLSPWLSLSELLATTRTTSPGWAAASAAGRFVKG